MNIRVSGFEEMVKIHIGKSWVGRGYRDRTYIYAHVSNA